jgi:thiamine-phosphate pyrophosphorylase
VLAGARLVVPRPRGCPLFVNDRVDVALAVRADGVHLPQAGLDVTSVRGMAPHDGFLVGVSAHDAASAEVAAAAGADLVALGPIWPTPAKATFGPPLGTDAIAVAAKALARSVHHPAAASGVGATGALPASPHGRGRRCRLFAIGGIEVPARAREARGRGADGVAVIRAVMAAPDPATAAAELVRAAT